ncbi:unnamed protein product, partial [Meganyctiphanes norvegica]
VTEVVRYRVPTPFRNPTPPRPRRVRNTISSFPRWSEIAQRSEATTTLQEAECDTNSVSEAPTPHHSLVRTEGRQLGEAAASVNVSLANGDSTPAITGGGLTRSYSLRGRTRTTSTTRRYTQTCHWQQGRGVCLLHCVMESVKGKSVSTCHKHPAGRASPRTKNFLPDHAFNYIGLILCLSCLQVRIMD